MIGNQEKFAEFTHNRIQHWDAVANKFRHRKGLGAGYHRRIAQVYQHLIPEGSSILEIGCGTGKLLASLKASRAIGVDFSPVMLEQARREHPECEFIQADAHVLHLAETFDFVILSDLINDLWDIQSCLNNIKNVCHPKTRLIINSFSHLWQLPLTVSAALGLSKPNLEQNWLEKKELENLLYLTDFEVLRVFSEFLWPINLPVIEPLINRFLVKIWPFNLLALTNVFVARPKPEQNFVTPSVSVIIPSRNEAGNIPHIFDRVPAMGSQTQLVFVEGHSQDDTYPTILETIASHPEKNCIALQQQGVGKGDAVRTGFEAASGEILMILDADMTVPPEDLTIFYQAMCSGKGDFINGIRLVYPMEKQAMRFLNLLGNKFFSIAFSWLMDQPIGDTLCGTKVLWKADYERIAANRSYFGDFDPFGDFDLLFGASRLNLKIVDLPIRYNERTYGKTNIQRWKHGFLLLKMLFVAAYRLKFI
jgi:ubiquinone/menaquinone biosynthesis C-methylase UbiE